MPTSTPPPYFPQGQLSPGDEKTRRRIKYTLLGCGVLIPVVLLLLLWFFYHLLTDMLPH